mgnify:CR=1 FL=1
MPRTTIRSEDITTGEVTSANIENATIVTGDIAATTITSGNMATDPTDASNLTSGSVPSGRLGNVDTAGIVANKEDIALLAFKVAANGSLARYNLIDQSVDAFETTAGVDAATSSGEYYSSAGNYYSGALAEGWVEGDRRSALTVTSDMTWYSGEYGIEYLVNGDLTYTADGGAWFNANQTGYIRFDHGSGYQRVYTNSRWTYKTASGTEGVYKWQGSDDASSWTDIGGNFNLTAVSYTHLPLPTNREV